MVLPDTNVWIQLLKGRNPSVLQKWRSVNLADVVVCSIVKAELWHGALKYDDPTRRRSVLDAWLAPYRSLPFNDEAAEHYADIRHFLERHNQVIGPNDLKIAAICRANGVAIATSNVREFRRVPSLRVEEWP
jgi:tRNA(fMet)-specific endonuclease VapC